MEIDLVLYVLIREVKGKVFSFNPTIFSFCSYIFLCILQWGGPPDLLIHEATMEHHMIYDAKIKKHSTFTEAIEEGRTVGADFIMLTHFSQRYSKLPVLEEMKDQPRVGIAFDMMEVGPSTMYLFPALYPALSRHFATYIQEMAERTTQT